MIDQLDIAIFMLVSSFAFVLMLVFKTTTKPLPKKVPVIRRRLDIVPSNSVNKRSVSTVFDHWFGKIVAKSGVGLDRNTSILIIGCTSVVAGAIGFVLEWQPVLQIAAGVSVFLVGIAIYYFMMMRRIRNFTIQFPTSLELLARATRAGEDLEAAMKVVGRTCDEPVRSEFQLCIRQLQMGLGPDRVTNDLASRIGTMDTQLFAHTVSVHQNLGGRLADALERLSSVIRDRTEYTEKIRSATGIGRFAVVAIVFMAFFVTCYLFLAQPEYIGKLVSSDFGQKMLIYAAVSEVVGLVWVGLTLKSEF